MMDTYEMRGDHRQKDRRSYTPYANMKKTFPGVRQVLEPQSGSAELRREMPFESWWG